MAFAADTHLHADFLSGAVQLAATDGATVLASRAGNREFPHRGLDDGDEVDLGGLTLRTMTTPGHTHEHIAFELLDGPRVVGVFTGGSLIVGSAARTDLVAPDRTEELARAQYRSLRRLADLDDDVAVWPTHGAGSFCSAPPGAERTSTIGTERATNTLLRAADEDDLRPAAPGLARQLPAVLPAAGRDQPPWARALVEGDQPRATDGRARWPAPGAGRGGRRRAAAGDLRRRPRARARCPSRCGPCSPPGSAGSSPQDQPLVIVRDADQDPAEILWQARKIGYDRHRRRARRGPRRVGRRRGADLVHPVGGRG